MRRLAIVIAVLLISCGMATAQNPAPYLCPTLSIEGPNRILKQGETAKFTAKVVAHGPELQIKYNWHVSYGTILSGQGTATIEVEKPPSSRLIATVNIAGTPDDSHCPQSHSEMGTWDAPPECPTVSVYRPAGTRQPGEMVPFTVQINPKELFFELKYRWTTTDGDIVTGQGTQSIEIKWLQKSTITATVEVIGLPKECGATASETVHWDPPPEAVRVGMIYSLETEKFEKLLKEFSDGLASNPSNQGYIFIGSKPDSKENDLVTREKKLIDDLAKLMGSSYDRSRLTLVRWGGKADLIELWRIPPGADNPTCKDCDTLPQCPTISITGPAGITQPGDKFVFTGTVEGDVPTNVSFQWEVSGGRIVEGQGTLRMSAYADWKQGGANVTATLNVLGLPSGCPKSASESGGAMCMCQSVLLDEFGKLASGAIKKKLDVLFAELDKNPNDQGYIILYGTEKEMNSRERLILDSIKFRSFDRPRITIARGGAHPAGTIYTKLYRVPPGADNPAP